MASQITLEEPLLQSVQAAEQEKQPTLVEGYFQPCEGHMKRRSKILKRWKKEYIKVIPGSYCTSLYWVSGSHIGIEQALAFCVNPLGPIP